MNLLNRELGNQCAVFGGAAGTIWTENQRVLQFYKKEILQDSIPILLWGGPLEYAFSIANSWKPVGKKVTVMEADGREVGADGKLPRVGNTVDLDREMAGMAENSLMYTLSAQIVAKKFQSLRNVIEGGNR